jgi:hypothetical protein
MKKSFGILAVVGLIIGLGFLLRGNLANENFRILLLGDTHFGENYGSIDLDELGYEYSFERFEAILERADFTVLNLETPLTDVKESPLEGKSYTHWSNPEKGGATLGRLGVDAVSLANNHSMDMGAEGLRDTFEALEANAIEYFGAGDNEEEASEAYVKKFVLEDEEFYLVLIGAFEYSKKYNEEYSFYASEEDEGVNPLLLNKVSQQILALKNTLPNAYVIVFPHWGDNYKNADEAQRNAAHYLVDAGADMIVGHGAHMLQDVEEYKGKQIVYSLGNFVFNSPGRYQKLDVDPFSLILELNLRKSLGDIDVEMRLYPIFTDNLITDYRSRFVSEREFEKVVEKLGIDSVGEDEMGRYMKMLTD